MGAVTPEVAVMRLAARQLGLFTTAQAEELLWTARCVLRRVRSGEIRVAQTGVFAFAGSPASWEQRLRAATLAAGVGCGVSHESLAILHGCEDWIDGFVRPVHVSVPARRQPLLTRASVHRVHLPAEHLTARDGIPCTTYARMIVDLSGRASLGQIARAIDHGLVRNRVTLRELWRCHAALPPAPGRRPSRVALLLGERVKENELGESRPEIRLMNAIRAGGLPTPVPQYKVSVAGQRFRFDVAYPEVKLGLEWMGFDPHRTRMAFDRDFRRDRIVSSAGWTVMYFTSACTDADIVADVASMLDRLQVPTPPSTPLGLMGSDR